MSEKRVHELKTWPVYFDGLLSGEKTFEVRRNDRMPAFLPGDLLRLREWDAETERYTGRILERRVTYVFGGENFGIIPGFVVMGLAQPNPQPEQGEQRFTFAEVRDRILSSKALDADARGRWLGEPNENTRKQGLHALTGVLATAFADVLSAAPSDIGDGGGEATYTLEQIRERLTTDVEFLGSIFGGDPATGGDWGSEDIDRLNSAITAVFPVAPSLSGQEKEPDRG